ncbi:FliZ protein [Salmonella enterica subsp. enterica serovar Daytona]|uniref:FliZ protein n=5 Tax=Salmonella enterica TaxID=28901 RepID=A0A447JGG8_SALET|nr:FliZ protein [Salmonella enterica subsp. enterica serovar Daytona]
MTVQQPKRRPLSRYLKDFKHSQTHCAHCHKLLDRITLVRRGKIVNKIAISQLDMLLDDAAWQREQKEWVALCRFCGDLHCKKQSDFFDIIGFKQYLFEQTEMSHARCGNMSCVYDVLATTSASKTFPTICCRTVFSMKSLAPWLPETSTNNYRIALRKYQQYKAHQQIAPRQKSPLPPVLIYIKKA